MASPGGVEVSRASVRILPDTSHLLADLQAELTAIEKKLNLDVKVTADTKDIIADVEAAKESVKKPVEVPVKANTDAWAAGIRAEALKLAKSTVVDIPLTSDGERLRQEIATQVALIEKLTKVEIPVDLEDAAKLRNKMALELDLLKSMAARANPTVDVNVELNDGDVARTVAGLGALNAGASGLVGSFSLLGPSAAVLSTSLIPLTAVLAGLAAALVAPLAVAGAGVTLFGFLSAFAVKNTLDQQKAIAKAQEKVDGLKKGTKEYRQALADLKSTQDAVTPAQTAFTGALGKVKSALSELPQGVLLKPLTDGLKLLSKAIPLATPIIKSVSGVLVDLLDDLNDLVSSPGFKGFVKAFAHDLGRDLRSLAKIAGNIFIGLGGLFGALDDTLSQGVLKSLENITGKFADFGRDAKNNKGLRAFVGYVKQNMPKVGDLIGNVFGVLGAALEELAPVSSAVLDFLNGILGAFQKLGQAAGPLAGALALGGIATLFGGPEAGLAVATIFGLVRGFKELYQRSRPLRQILGDLGDFFRDTLLPRIKDAADDVIPALKGAIKDVTDTIRDNKGLFEVLGKAILFLGSAAVVTAIEQTVGTIKLIGKAFKFGTAAVKIWANVTIALFQVILQGLKLLVGLILSQFATIVDGAAAAFGWLPKIGGPIKDAQRKFHEFTGSINSDIDTASGTLSDLQRQINVVGNQHPSFHIDSNTLDLIAQMHKIDAFRFKDKDFTVTAHFEQEIERVRAPGGGMGRPGDIQSGNSGASTGRPSINIDKVEVRDVDDLLRKADSIHRGRAGGGVALMGA